jgi:hypothetical protein
MMNPLKIACASLLFGASLANAANPVDLASWTIEGSVQMDPSKPGPDGKPSIKVEPKAKAALKLREADGSGKVTLSVYDDGMVASPDKKKSVGPRWGTSESSGRVLVGAIMYAKYLQPEGSLCLIDADPKEKSPWLAVKFLGPRGQPGWKKWEFDFNPATGLQVSVDGKPVPQKYFDWNVSKVTGFNGLIFYGDDTPGATAQTVWIADITYELGPPMTVKPGALPTPTPPPPAQALGPAPEEETEKSTEPPVVARMDGFIPGPRLLDDLKNLKIPLVEGYASQHPRLLFSANDRESLQKRALERPDLWNAVLASAAGVKPLESVPTPDVIRSGAKYWRIEKVQSAALAWFITGEQAYAEGAIRWMVAHAREAIWGDKYRPNLDLVAAWYLYHIAVGYDILKDQMTEEDRIVIRRGLAEHARHIYIEHDPHKTEDKIRYDQNHTYIPTVAMAAAALALLEDEPEAKYWLTRGYAVLRRSRYVQSEDGFYYEGFGYWAYALGWQARGAELLARATGEKLFEIPVLRDTWLFGLHMRLPETVGAYGLGDGGGWKDGVRGPMGSANGSMLWEVASQTGVGESRTVGDLYFARDPEKEYPATAFLRYNPEVAAKPLEQIPPYHYFPDHDVVAWRSGWGDEATSYLFRCGPPLGHKAAEKLGRLKDWTMNCGHVHPNIGGFWMFAKGAYMAVDTGYTVEKWTRDQNTLLVDEKGQGVDGSYWNERGANYADLNEAHITSQYLGAEYGFARGEFGSAYRHQVPGVDLTRSLLMTKRWLLIVDDMTADKPHHLTWLCHSLAEFHKDGQAYVARQSGASLAVLPLTPGDVQAKPEPTIVVAGRAPGRGAPEQRGFKLGLRTAAQTAQTRFINLLVPLAPDEKLPEAKLTENEGNRVALEIRWPDGKTESVSLDLGWKAGGENGPAQIALK